MSINVGGHFLSTEYKNYSNPKILTDNLIIHVDAAKYTSGGTWNDLSGNSNNLTINGSATTTLIGGTPAFNLDTDGKYFTNTSLSGTMPSTNATIEAWIYPESIELTGGDRGTIVLMRGISGMYMSWNKSNQKLSNYWYNHTPEGYHESTLASSRNSWTHWCSVWNNPDGKLYQWVDGVKTEVTTSGDYSTGTEINIGRESSLRQFHGGIAIVRVYNIALSDKQVLSNFEAQKLRFGL
jgi:hypothetical protein